MRCRNAIVRLIALATCVACNAAPNAQAPAPAVPNAPTTTVAPAKAAAPTPEPRGDVVACRTNPRFIASMKEFSSRSFFSTSDRLLKGLVLVDGTTPTKQHQHPSWSSFGWLAGIHYDGQGNIFSVPAPRINVFDNKPDQQNRVFKVDTLTGEMKVLAVLPSAAPPSDQNPYGALGVAYDCETQLLYVSSISGSTRSKEVGRIFAIDPNTGAVKFTRENVDAIGLHLFRRDGEKRVYYGRARDPEIWSVAVDKNGAFKGDARLEISLEGMGPRGDDRARRINFTPTNEMIVFGIEFSVNLVAPTEKQETQYRFKYDTKEKRWARQLEVPFQQ
jgi:DNA-binding beta-propeller fold protein YncE